MKANVKYNENYLSLYACAIVDEILGLSILLNNLNVDLKRANIQYVRGAMDTEDFLDFERGRMLEAGQYKQNSFIYISEILDKNFYKN